MLGIHSPKVREKLLNVGSELMLEKAKDVARSHELAQAQLKTIASSMSTSREHAVHAISDHTSKGSVSKQRNAKYTKSYSDSRRLEMLLQCTPKVAATVETSVMLIAFTVLQKERCAKYVVN